MFHVQKFKLIINKKHLIYVYNDYIGSRLHYGMFLRHLQLIHFLWLKSGQIVFCSSTKLQGLWAYTRLFKYSFRKNQELTGLEILETTTHLTSVMSWIGSMYRGTILLNPTLLGFILCLCCSDTCWSISTQQSELTVTLMPVKSMALAKVWQLLWLI